MNAADRLDERFGFAFYRVPAEATEEFLEWARRAADVYERHALSWSLWRDRGDPEEFVERGPDFRERADLERAAAALEDEGILDRLATFESSSPSSPNYEADVGMVSFLFVSDDYEPVFEVGGARGGSIFDEPAAIDPAEMSPAMKRAQALARELALRLGPVVPPPYRVTAEQERIYIRDERGMGTGGSIVDLEIEAAVERVLADVQDELTEHLAVPWPHDPERGYVFHEPGIAVRDGAVHLWYGDERDPVLTFEPIQLRALGGRG